MTVKICASVIAPTLIDTERMINEAEVAGADLIEVRLDYVREKYHLREVRGLTALPLIATNRPLSEGGLFEGPEEERIRLLSSAAEADFDFVDIELSAEGSKELIQRFTASGVKTIVSSHTLKASPTLSVLDQIFQKERDTSASVCKIVTSATKYRDNLMCFQFLEKVSRKKNVTCFCTGRLGVPSRLLSPLFGGCFTYASVEHGSEAAPGQLTVAEMRRIYEILGV